MDASQQQELSIEEVLSAASAEVQKKETGRRIQLIIFKLGAEEYALPIDQIKEVVLTPRIARMPHTPPYIKGVANIRGSIIAIMDLETRLGISPGAEKEARQDYTLVVESEVFKAGFLVREVPNTLAIAETEIDSSSGFIQNYAMDAGCIQGVVKADNRLIILIDMAKLMESIKLPGLSNKPGTQP